jgi:hypothetical protein
LGRVGGRHLADEHDLEFVFEGIGIVGVAK